jgi:hypothetical protein
VVLLSCPFEPEIIHERAPEVFLHQWSWNVAIWPILCLFDVKRNQTNKQKLRISKWILAPNSVLLIYIELYIVLLFIFFH